MKLLGGFLHAVLVATLIGGAIGLGMVYDHTPLLLWALAVMTWMLGVLIYAGMIGASQVQSR